MPSQSAGVTTTGAAHLAAIGQQLRVRRRALGVKVITAAESAGISRVTWYRIEKGVPSVAMGAYFAAMDVLGMTMWVTDAEKPGTFLHDEREGMEWIPARIPLSRFPALKKLAWQVHGTETLSPRAALDIYERNQRHIDENALSDEERALIHALRLAFDESRKDV